MMIVAATLLMMACSDDRVMDYILQEDTPVNVHLALNVAPMTGNVIETRSAHVDEATQEDNEIHNIWVLQFRGTTAADSLREARYYKSYDPTQMYKLIASSVPNRVVIVANTFDSLIAFSHCADMAEFIESYRTVRDERCLDSIVAGKHCALMSAYQDVTLNEAGVTLNFNLLRTICKVDVTITNTTKETTATDVDIKSVTVCSVPSRSFFFNSYSLPNRYPAVFNGDRISYPAMNWTDGTPGGNDEQRSFTFYLPVNKSGTAAVPGNPLQRNAYAPDGATYICIRGTYDDPVDPSIKRPVEYNIMLGDNDTDYNLLPNSKYNYNITIDDIADTQTDSRQVEQALVDYCSQEHANTYMIHPSNVEGTWKNYRIPVAKCYDFWNTFEGYYKDAANALMPGGYGWKVEVIWSEQPITYDTNFKWIKDEGTDYRDYFEFSLPYGVEHGSIVIGIRRYTDAGRTQLTDEFIWSWQMWVTDYNPDVAFHYTPEYDIDGNETHFEYSVPGGDVHRYNTAGWKEGAKYDGCFVMDRNLGALSTAYRSYKAKGFLLYWYGRKDPHAAPGQTVYYGPSNVLFARGNPNDTAIRDRNLYVIYNPTTFWEGYEWSGEWRNSAVYTAAGLMWGDPRNKSAINKGVFDPCPPGWRVPTKDAFASLSWVEDGSNGRKAQLAPNVYVRSSSGVTRDSNTYPRFGLEWVYPAFTQFWCADATYYHGSYELPSKLLGKFVRCVTDKPFD